MSKQSLLKISDGKITYHLKTVHLHHNIETFITKLGDKCTSEWKECLMRSNIQLLMNTVTKQRITLLMVNKLSQLEKHPFSCDESKQLVDIIQWSWKNGIRCRAQTVLVLELLRRLDSRNMVL